ncbi:predicted protein [Nematostella vectensis]|uniref:G-protein coupled receptors family 1 profile domain-containing protein n=1 Tax=Nematostella vectensis TaxID=45351 RepID=A7SAY8_NEMVE|nr:predicted protein [Nematostella vectensis]|eukprot:XP_001631195.1 predicted protein [Nematostella vectensis]
MAPNTSFLLAEMKAEVSSRETAIFVAEFVVFLLLLILILFGNSLTLYVVLSNRRLRTVTNLFVVSLAVSDLGMGVFVLALGMVALYVSRWPFGDAVCQYKGFFAITLAAASIQTLALTSVNRYFKVVKPSLYRKYFTMRATIICILSSWFVATLAAIPYLATGFRMIYHPGKFVCYYNDTSWWLGTVIIIYVGLPNSVIVFCYYQVFKTVKIHQKRLQSTQNNRSNVSVEDIKITRTLFVVVVFFMFCWAPYMIVDLVDVFRGYWSMSREVYTMSTFLGTLSSAVNPVIYCFLNPSFRREYSRSLGLRRRRTEDRCPTRTETERNAIRGGDNKIRVGWTEYP